MKAYIISVPESIQKFSEQINIKAMLCDKSWVVFNDKGSKIVFIFEKKGGLIISENGIVKRAKWNYVKANKSILIENDNQTTLLHPTYVDDILFVMQQDGTEYYIVMIEEQRAIKWALTNHEAVKEYLTLAAQSKSSDYIEQREKEEKQKRNEEFKRNQALRTQAREESQEEIRKATQHLQRQLNTTLIIGAVATITIIIFAFILQHHISDGMSILIIVLIILIFVACFVIGDRINTDITTIEEEIINRQYAHLKEYTK